MTCWHCGYEIKKYDTNKTTYNNHKWHNYCLETWTRGRRELDKRIKQNETQIAMAFSETIGSRPF